jgi:hypothetical protein
VSGQVTVLDTSSAANMTIYLNDGTTTIDSATITTPATSYTSVVHLSGYIVSPAGNLRISVKDTSTTAGQIKFNSSGLSKDSTITAIRIA